VQVPDPRLVQEVLRDERAHRADVHDVARPRRVLEPVAEERVDDRTVPALHHAEAVILRDLAHEPDATGAHDAPVAVVEDVAAEVVPAEDPLRLDRPSVLPPLGGHVVLELALARLVADRAVERVIDQVELEDALARLPRLRTLGQDRLAVRDLRDARGRELRRTLDLDQAHAAHGRSRERRMVAVVRDAHAELLGRLDDARAFRDLDRTAVDRTGDRVLRFVGCQPVPRLLRSAGLTRRPDRIVIVQAATVAADPLPPRISARYSSRNFLIELATGAAAESLSTQIVVPVMFRPRSSSVSRSASVPCPLSIRRRILT